MEQSLSSEPDKSSADQDIQAISKMYYHVENGRPLDPVRTQLSVVHILTPYAIKIHFNIISLCC
jgi:hypothetical protein